MKGSLVIGDFFILEIMTETPEERKKRFKEMSSYQRQALLRQKMKAQGLVEGSGVPEKDLSSYDQDEIWDLIQVTSCLTEMQTKSREMSTKATRRKKSFTAWILIAIALTIGMVFFYQQYPSPETRRELSVDGMFFD